MKKTRISTQLVHLLFEYFLSEVLLNLLVQYRIQQEFLPIFAEKVIQMFEDSYYELSYVEDESYWKKYFYESKKLPFPGDYVDCSFLCKYVEKTRGCDVFKYEVIRNIIVPN